MKRVIVPDRPRATRRVPGRPAPPPRERLVHVTTVPQTLEFLGGQVGRMKARGFEVTALSSPGPGLDAFGRREGVRTLGVEMPRAITPWGDLRALARLVRIFRRLRPHVVHAHTPKAGLLGMIGAALAGVPIRIYTLHGLPLETAVGIRRRILRWAERVSCLLAHRVHAVGPSLRERALREGLCRPEKVKVLGAGTINGVDAAERFSPGPASAAAGREVRRSLGIPGEAPVLGFAGRLVRDKGIAELVEAWKELRRDFPDLHLLVAGAFESRDPVPPAAARALRTDPRVHLAGHVPSMAPIYAAMDVLALPTWREGFPQVPLEAAAMELPVVASRATGCGDAVVDGVTGTLVPVGDARALAAAVRTYLERPDLREQHGRAGRARVLRDFRPQAVCDRLHREYREFLGPERSPRFARRHLHRRPLDLLVKRVVDVAGSLLGLLLFAPVMLGVALAVRLDLGSPVLFRQMRPGLKGRPFTLLKFRTMKQGRHPDEQRLTAVGRFLRSTSLDELPQLWNVLRGEMSLVGPRPLRMEYLDRYTPEQARRHDVRPGITGRVQVNGRNGLSWDEKFSHDLWYVDHGSLRVDLEILARTVTRVLARTGINAPGGNIMPEFMGAATRPFGE